MCVVGCVIIVVVVCLFVCLFFVCNSIRVLANPPVPLEVYQKCIDLEKGSSGCVLTMDVPRLRDIYERAIREHGSCSHG